MNAKCKVIVRFATVAVLLAAIGSVTIASFNPVGATASQSGSQAVMEAGVKASDPNHDLVVQGYVYGESELHFRGNAVFWVHKIDLPPGLPQTENFPTILNDVDWFPTWNDCLGKTFHPWVLIRCESSYFHGIPPLKTEPQTVVVACEGNYGSDWEYFPPTAQNNYTLRIIFYHNSVPGGRLYTCNIDYDYNVTPINIQILKNVFDTKPASLRVAILGRENILPNSSEQSARMLYPTSGLGWKFSIRINGVPIDKPRSPWLDKSGLPVVQMTDNNQDGRQEPILSFRVPPDKLVCGVNIIKVGIRIPGGQQFEGTGNVTLNCP